MDTGDSMWRFPLLARFLRTTVLALAVATAAALADGTYQARLYEEETPSWAGGFPAYQDTDVGFGGGD